MATQLSFLLSLLSLTLLLHGIKGFQKDKQQAQSGTLDQRQLNDDSDFFTLAADVVQRLSSAAKSFVFFSSTDKNEDLESTAGKTLIERTDKGLVKMSDEALVETLDKTFVKTPDEALVKSHDGGLVQTFHGDLFKTPDDERKRKPNQIHLEDDFYSHATVSTHRHQPEVEEENASKYNLNTNKYSNNINNQINQFTDKNRNSDATSSSQSKKDNKETGIDFLKTIKTVDDSSTARQGDTRGKNPKLISPLEKSDEAVQCQPSRLKADGSAKMPPRRNLLWFFGESEDPATTPGSSITTEETTPDPTTSKTSIAEDVSTTLTSLPIDQSEESTYETKAKTQKTSISTTNADEEKTSEPSTFQTSLTPQTTKTSLASTTTEISKSTQKTTSELEVKRHTKEKPDSTKTSTRANGSSSKAFTTSLTDNGTGAFTTSTRMVLNDASSKTTKSVNLQKEALNDSGRNDLDFNTGSVQKLKALYETCDSCMSHWNSDMSTTECPHQVYPALEFDKAAREFSNMLRYGCDGPGLNKSRCCHTYNSEVYEVVNKMTQMSEAVTKTLKEQCNKCPKNCLWQEWSNWKGCPPLPTCGDQPRQYSTRIRTSEKELYGGRPCSGGDTDQKTCPQIPTVAGVWQPWSSWSSCSGSCSGIQTRTRNCTEPTICFRPCSGSAMEWRSCGDMDLCCAPRQWTPWEDWSPCGSTPGRPQRHRVRSRRCEADPRSNELWCQKPCPGTHTETEDCCTKSKWNIWSPWSSCSSSTGQADQDTGQPCGDGAGYQNRTRTCQKGTCGESCDGEDTQTQQCCLPSCCVTPKLSSWAEWSVCSGNSLKSRRQQTCRRDLSIKGARFCLTGGPCQTQSEEKDCRCETPQWGSWREWEGCESERFQTRHRACMYPIGNSRECSPDLPQTCVGKKEERMPCPCAPTMWSSWGEWESCVTFLGRTTQVKRRLRMCEKDRTSNLLPCPDHCPGSNVQTEECCVPSQWTSWTSWSQCDSQYFKVDLDTGEPCGPGTGCRNRTRICAPGTCETKHCEGDSIDHDMNCTVTQCCAPRILSPWGSWEPCSSQSGFTTRRRQCHSNDTKPSGSRDCRKGDNCQSADLKDEKPCVCDLVLWETWQSWSDCSPFGTRTRTRRCNVPRDNGPECGSSNASCAGTSRDTERCMCDWTQWNRWTDCDTARIRSRSRQCVQRGTNRDCWSQSWCAGSGNETELCPCERPEWSNWYPWTPCDFEQSPPIRTRYRICNNGPDTCGGCIGKENESEQCFCERAEYGPWGTFSVCRPDGYGGYARTRYRACHPMPRSNPDYCRPAPPEWTNCQGENYEQRQCVIIPERLEDECRGRVNGEYPSSERGCKKYVTCCNERATQRPCEPPKLYDAICQECLSESATCGADGYDRYKDIRSIVEIMEPKHGKCTSRSKRSIRRGCHLNG